MIMFEVAAVSDSARPFCATCYKLKGNSPPILVAWQVMNKVDN